MCSYTLFIYSSKRSWSDGGLPNLVSCVVVKTSIACNCINTKAWWRYTWKLLCSISEKKKKKQNYKKGFVPKYIKDHFQDYFSHDVEMTHYNALLVAGSTYKSSYIMINAICIKEGKIYKCGFHCGTIRTFIFVFLHCCIIIQQTVSYSEWKTSKYMYEPLQHTVKHMLS